MKEPTSGRRHAILGVLMLAALALGANLTLLTLRRSIGTVSGDEGTFLAMAASLAAEGDLAFDQRDLARIELLPRSGRTDIILQTTESGVFFSKPALYPLFGAPFFRMFSDAGLVAANVAALALALLLAWQHLGTRHGPVAAALMVVTFAGTSVVPAYAAWTMSDALQAALVLAGAALCLGSGPLERPVGGFFDRLTSGRIAFGTGALGLGLAAAMRYPNVLLALGVALALAVDRRWRRSLLVLALVAAGFGVGLALNQGLGGAAVPYKTLRATFTPETGYPAGDNADEALEQFRAGEATQRVGLRPRLLPAMTVWSTVYFFIGRHTGLAVYFPFAVFLLWSVVRKPDARGLVLGAAACGVAVFYLVWLPWNFFGGASFLGNRYFLTAYAILLFAPSRRPGRWMLGATWAMAVVVFASAAVSTVRTRDRDGTSQVHANAGVFRLLPYETTARDLDGRRDRYWSDEFIRFVDPFADVKRVGFRISTDEAPAEILVANSRDFGLIRLIAASDCGECRLVYEDWLKTESFELGKAIHGFGRLVEVVPSRALRRHSFWWDESGSHRYARVFRLGLRGPPGSRAEIRVVGPYRLVPRFYRAESPGPELVSPRIAGTREKVSLDVLNRGRRYWSSDDAIPIHLGYSLYRLPREVSSEPLRSRLAPLVERVEPGGQAQLDIEVRWPSMPGEYEVVFDLAVAGVAWFGDWNEGPLATARVELEAEPEEGRTGD